VKPDIHGVRTRWIRGFMPFQLTRRTRIVVLMVPTRPESVSGYEPPGSGPLAERHLR
jgi:hypothetical protein